MQELQVLRGNKGVVLRFSSALAAAKQVALWRGAQRAGGLLSSVSLQMPEQCLPFSSFFVFNIFSYTLLLFNFHNFNSRFFMFCFFQLITHRLSGQEWTWCFHVLSCLSFPPCDPSHNIVWVDQSERENEHLRWLQCNDSLLSVQNLSGGFKEVTLPCTFC